MGTTRYWITVVVVVVTFAAGLTWLAAAAGRAGL